MLLVGMAGRKLQRWMESTPSLDSISVHVDQTVLIATIDYTLMYSVPVIKVIKEAVSY